MKPTSPNPTSNALFGLKQEAPRTFDPEAAAGLLAGDDGLAERPRARPPWAWRLRRKDFMAAAGRALAWTFMRLAWAATPLTVRVWRRTLRENGSPVRAAVHTSRGSFFLRRLEVRP